MKVIDVFNLVPGLECKPGTIITPITQEYVTGSSDSFRTHARYIWMRKEPRERVYETLTEDGWIYDYENVEPDDAINMAEFDALLLGSALFGSIQPVKAKQLAAAPDGA